MILNRLVDDWLNVHEGTWKCSNSAIQCGPSQFTALSAQENSFNKCCFLQPERQVHRNIPIPSALWY